MHRPPRCLPSPTTAATERVGGATRPRGDARHPARARDAPDHEPDVVPVSRASPCVAQMDATALPGRSQSWLGRWRSHSRRERRRSLAKAGSNPVGTVTVSRLRFEVEKGGSTLSQQLVGERRSLCSFSTTAAGPESPLIQRLIAANPPIQQRKRLHPSPRPVRPSDPESRICCIPTQLFRERRPGFLNLNNHFPVRAVQ